MIEPDKLNMEDLQRMSFLERMHALQERATWLEQQRAAEKHIYIQENKTSASTTWKLKGLCPNCKEHSPIFKQGRCKACYEKYR